MCIYTQHTYTHTTHTKFAHYEHFFVRVLSVMVMIQLHVANGHMTGRVGVVCDSDLRDCRLAGDDASSAV